MAVCTCVVILQFLQYVTEISQKGIISREVNPY
jgi:hypothetical protein